MLLYLICSDSSFFPLKGMALRSFSLHSVNLRASGLRAHRQSPYPPRAWKPRLRPSCNPWAGVTRPGIQCIRTLRVNWNGWLSRHGLLPSTSPYDIIDDGPTWVNFKGRKTPQVSLMDCPDSWWWSSMFGNVYIYILYGRQACRVCRLDMFDGNMYVATTSALTWCIVVALVFPFNFPPSGSSL